MNLKEYRTVFASGSLILILVSAAPMLSLIVPPPGGRERFSELWLLDLNHMAEDYPFNVREKEYYSVFLGLRNHMGGLEYYVAYVKLSNQTESLPDGVNETPSPLMPLHDFHVFLSEEEIWEKKITFSFSGIRVEGNVCRISYMTIAGFTFLVNETTLWNIENRGYYFQLFFELWRFNATTKQFQFHNRFVGIWLNMTTSL